jgi:integrase
VIKKHGRLYRLDVWISGKRVRRSLRTDERALALDRARDIERELRTPKKPGLHFADFKPKYLEWARQTKPSSYVTEKYRLAILENSLTAAGISTLNEITPWHVEQFRAEILNRKIGQTDKTVGKSSANRYLALLRTMINRARDWGLFEGENPVSRVRLYREGQKVRPLTEAEIQKVLEAARAISAKKGATPLACSLYDICSLILNTGLRRSEALNLRWTDVGDDELRIRGKGGKVRMIPINAETALTLGRQLRLSAYVFDVPNRNRDGLLRRVTETITRQTGVRFHVHLLRHAFASRLLAAGVDVVTISSLLGHGHAMTTLLYAHSNPRLMRQAVDTLPGHRHVSTELSNSAK